MERLYRAGIHKFIVVVGEDEGAVAAYLNSQWLPNVRIEFMIQPLTSSLTKSLATIARNNPAPFLLTTYNTFTHANFPETLLNFHKEDNQCLILTAAPTTLSKSQPYAFIQENNGKVSITHQFQPDADPAQLILELAICSSHSLNISRTKLRTQAHQSSHRYFLTLPTAYTDIRTRRVCRSKRYDLLTQPISDDGHNHILSNSRPVSVSPPVRIDPQ
jgi:hypothetical protein